MDDTDERLVQLLADAFRLDIERREQAVADETPDVRAPALAAAAALGAELSDEPSQVSDR